MTYLFLPLPCFIPFHHFSIYTLHFSSVYSLLFVYFPTFSPFIHIYSFALLCVHPPHLSPFLAPSLAFIPSLFTSSYPSICSIFIPHLFTLSWYLFQPSPLYSLSFLLSTPPSYITYIYHLFLLPPTLPLYILFPFLIYIPPLPYTIYFPLFLCFLPSSSVCFPAFLTSFLLPTLFTPSLICSTTPPILLLLLHIILLSVRHCCLQESIACGTSLRVLLQDPYILIASGKEHWCHVWDVSCEYRHFL